MIKRLVDASHARGLAVILDVVYNHWARPLYSPDLVPISPSVATPGRGFVGRGDEVRRSFH
jgi:hypothetical protein